MDKEQARKLYELADRLSKLDVNTLSEEQLAERTAMIARLQEVKQRLDPKCWDGYKKQGTKIKGGVRVNNCVPESIEEANGEYDDEAGMAESNLRTMARAVNGLLDTIEDNDNLPEWAQEKIAKAEMMVTSVWDYLLSQKEQGVDPKVEGVVEGSDNITAVFSGYGNYMKGRGANVFKHYGITVLDKQYDEDEDIAEYTVSGNKAALDQARAYLERSDQFGGMILKQGVAEAKKPSPKLTPVEMKKTDPVSEEINTEAYERLQKVFAFKNYES